MTGSGKRAFLALLAFFALIASVVAAQDAAKQSYLNPKLPPEERAADLVHRMTLEEKASQLVNQARAIPRLGVPAYDWWSEALHGVAVNGTTEFPEPIGLAATFDAPRIHQMAIAIGTEARVIYARDERNGNSLIFHGLDFWAPNVNIFRDPRWGRGQETYGEDPFLSGRMAVAFVTGMQGVDPHYYRVISTPKHFDVHSGPEPTRHIADVDVSKHDEEDTYLPAFRAAIVEGHAGSVMCAYNAINGEPACANQFLLQHTLRGAWQFQGYVVSDCGAVRNIFEGHHYRPTQPQASAISLERGMDNECIDFTAKVTDDHDYRPYIEAVQQGYLSVSAIDTALIRLFSARIRLGLFDPPDTVSYTKIDKSELDSPEHRALARRIADESIVLLKNDGVLPLKKSVKRIAIVGPLADQTEVLLGNYNGIPTHTVSMLEGMKAEFPGAEITYVPGTRFLSNPHKPTFTKADNTPDPAAIAAARNADVVIAVVGITSLLEGEEMPVDQPGFLGGDRTNLDMPEPEEALVQAVATTGKPLVVVLMNGSALGVNWEKAHANAVLEAWYSGEEGGTAIADTLSGKNDPGGRLPVTFYKDVHQLPNFEDYSMNGRTYRYFEGQPLWPFGYGLSYTTFKYSYLNLPSAPISAGDPLDVSVTVTNTGNVAGDEVAELYLKFPDVAGAPIRALRGFQRVHLEPGASHVVKFHLRRRDLSMVTDMGGIIVAQGKYTLSIGGGQPGTGAPSVSGDFQVSGQIMLPE
ncbi:MAG TPA: glycoside hydrolase family 3 C-terminal domain-containing protein [Candidatus Acidoferrum sp.]|nr:glycoside hydrolase family 3 C-terminal domain-containing protein [Candidatus Acidoferrum sp.]